jgi:hypothetical protein
MGVCASEEYLSRRAAIETSQQLTKELTVRIFTTYDLPIIIPIRCCFPMLLSCAECLYV